MQIKLFSCNAERNRINKQQYIQNEYCLNGSLRKETSVKDIVIGIERDNFIPYKYNYMYISEFQRWYFINDIISVRNNYWEIHASVDVLYSFIGDIYSSEAIVEKAEAINENLYLNDGSFVMDTRKYNEIIEFPNGLNTNGEYVLICAGGV